MTDIKIPIVDLSGLMKSKHRLNYENIIFIIETKIPVVEISGSRKYIHRFIEKITFITV